MFWGTFSYNTKGLCYVYEKETAAQTKQYAALIKAHNNLQMPAIQAKWDIKVAADIAKWAVLNRLKPGKLALFVNFVKRHPLIMSREKNNGGIDHMRYRYEVVEPLIIPYIRERAIQLPHDPDNLNIPGPIFQQDNAVSHKSKWTLALFAKEGIELLEYPGNSPDMSAIKKA
jgi:hypothetical protein